MVSSGTEEMIESKASRSPGSERPQTEMLSVKAAGACVFCVFDS